MPRKRKNILNLQKEKLLLKEKEQQLQISKLKAEIHDNDKVLNNLRHRIDRKVIQIGELEEIACEIPTQLKRLKPTSTTLGLTSLVSRRKQTIKQAQKIHTPSAVLYGLYDTITSQFSTSSLVKLIIGGKQKLSKAIIRAVYNKE